MLEKEITGTLVPNRDYSMQIRIHGGFQCDDMGLGKTIQMAATMYNNLVERTLLIAPLAMISTWSEVCLRIGMRVYEIENGQWTCKNDIDAPVPMRFVKKHPAIFITNYEKMYHAPSLFRLKWDRVVLDEAHKIRNGDSYLALLARKLIAPIRWIITGTPLVNSDKDIVSLMAFLGVPYSRLWKWEPRYLRILPDLLIHRTLDSLRSTIKGAPPVPEINHIILPFTTKEEEEFYLGVQGATEELLVKYEKDVLSNSEMFKLLLRLRQISVHPQVFINAKRREGSHYKREDWSLPCTKFEKIKEIICGDSLNTMEGVHRYIIFCQFQDEMDLLYEFLHSRSLVENIFMYNGSLNQKDRTAILKQSKEATGTSAMLIQLQAGGVGLNLQEYDRIIFMSPWWTSALMDQAVARAVRMGQTNIVKVYHLELAAENDNIINIDMLINARADEKRERLKYIFLVAGSITPLDQICK